MIPQINYTFESHCTFPWLCQLSFPFPRSRSCIFHICCAYVWIYIRVILSGIAGGAWNAPPEPPAAFCCINLCIIWWLHFGCTRTCHERASQRQVNEFKRTEDAQSCPKFSPQSKCRMQGLLYSLIRSWGFVAHSKFISLWVRNLRAKWICSSTVPQLTVRLNISHNFPRPSLAL